MKRLIMVLLMIAILCPAATAMVGTENPWREVTAEELMQIAGVEFGVPEGAENVIFRLLEKENLAEMQFGWQGIACAARIKSTAEFVDISGRYGPLTELEEVRIGWCEGKILGADADEELIRLCLWYDAAPGLMYSLGTVAPAGTPVDILAMAEAVYIPTQGEVG